MRALAEMEELLTLKNAGKRFGSKVVLENVNLSIYKGQTLGIIGNNGTGKSTLLRIIAGLSNLSQGERIINENNGKLKLSYVPEHFPKLNFSPYEYLSYMGKMQGYTGEYVDKRLDELFGIFNITSMKNTWIKYLSKGSIQKIAVLQAILDDPDILLLDGPLSGQDVTSQHNLVEILLGYKKKGLSIIIACHEKKLIDKLADRVIIIGNMGIVSDVDYRIINRSYRLICFKAPANIDPNIIKQYEGFISMSQNGQFYKLLADTENSDNILINILKLGCNIISVNEFQNTPLGPNQFQEVKTDD
jgi:ABC-type multidrug transport system ATPase subunit